MGLMDMLLQNLAGDTIGKIASQVGGDQNKISEVLAALTPLLTNEVKNKLADPNVDSAPILEKVSDPSVQAAVENPTEFLEKENVVEEGNNILSYITGSKEKSTQIASAVAEQTGFDLSSIKKLLPIVAPLIMGTLGKAMSGSQSASADSISSQESSLLSFLDFDNDGSVIDDVIGMAGKFFRS